jgi:hypothetical protein
MRIFHPVLGSMKGRWRPTWPVCLLEDGEVSQKAFSEAGVLQGFMSEPMGNEPFFTAGIESMI